MSDKYTWLLYVALAGLSWGTYVPIIFYGGGEFGGKPNARLMAILCVGAAYFVIGVMLPLALFLTGQLPWPTLKSSGLIFSSLAGVAGAVGAICVVFATSSAKAAAGGADTYKVFIAPLIFGLAPVINVLVSMFWHPAPNEPWHFGFKSPPWLLWVGIFFVAIGAALVLYSKEMAEAEEAQHKKAQATGKLAAPSPGGPEAQS
jgi:hypothetical protein